MPAVQTKYGRYPDPVEAPVATAVKLITRNEKPLLELQVNIEGQDRNILLPLDALNNLGLSGLVAAKEVALIRESLENLVFVQTETQSLLREHLPSLQSLNL
ncbi:MAG: hypothetical protein OXE56_05775 [Gammaproteobacteria bacterium]|nr:hypothetical protein [Gammaproteobacteria bacterium]